MHGMDAIGWDFGAGLLMLLWWLVPIAAAVVLTVWLCRRSGRRPREDEALDILRQRFARGEIGADEFQEFRRHLGG